MTFFGADLFATIAAAIAAAATIVLAIFAIVTAKYAKRAFEKQSEEVEAIEQQVKDGEKLAEQQADLLKVQSDQLDLQQRQFDRDQAERRRAQAAQVFIMIDGTQNGGQGEQRQVILMATAGNTSQLPVYDLWARWRTANGEFGIPTVAPQFLPGETKPVEVIWTEAAGIEKTSVSLDFRDAVGVHWRTTDRGILTELCGVESPSPALNRCTFAPKHDGPHSWEEEFERRRGVPGFPLR